MSQRKSNLTSPKSVEIFIIPDAEKVNEAAKLLAPGYKRALLKKLKANGGKPPAARNTTEVAIAQTTGTEG